MSPEIARYLALLEQRLSLLRALARQLVDCRRQFVAMDLDGMYGRIAEQEELCRQIQSLDPAIDSLQRTCAKQLDWARLDVAGQPEDAACAGRLCDVLRKLAEAQTEVRRLSQIHAAYLRRSRRTVDVLANFLGQYALTYARPQEPVPQASRIEERGRTHG